MSLRGNPHDAAGTRGARPSGSRRAPRRARAPPAGGRPAPEGHFVRAFRFFSTYFQNPVSRGRTAGCCSTRKPGRQSLSALIFHQNIPPSLVTAMCSFQSFCRLSGPTCFMGIDTYINIYINIYESIFLSSYTWRLHGLYRRHVFILYTDFARQTRQLRGRRKMPFLFPSHDICRFKRWEFFCKTKP